MYIDLDEKPSLDELYSAMLGGDDEYLEHYGIKRRSGRYPWGSGDDPYQHTNGDFLSRVEELKKTGWKETPENIKTTFGMTTSQYRIEKSICKSDRQMYQVETARRLAEKEGLGPTEIARKMGIKNESTVRSWLNPNYGLKMNEARETAEFLKKQVDEKGMIDIGAGVEIELGISKEKLNQAVYLLQKEGYLDYSGGVAQPTNKNQQTTQRVLCKPGTEHKDIYNYENVKTITDYNSTDGGKTFDKVQYPRSLDSKRVNIRYAEDGGKEKDGVIEIRRGLDDLNLDGRRYAQVRILVDNDHYLKGMAVYSDGKDMPDGVDVIFNTNKTKDKSMNEVLKSIKDDPDNPFGALITAKGQSYYIDPKTGKKTLNYVNRTRNEGEWEDWKDAIPSQFLSKQSTKLAKQQLDLAKADKMDEFDDIMAIDNPTIRRHYLQEFADKCDKAAVTLQAAALPGQKYGVILPINSLKDTEVYAPRYENGTKLALIRYPHGGIFEIPILTVNNKNQEARKVIGTDSSDAVGITHKVAERLSGADFDGDTVMCIPTHDSRGRVKIASKDPLPGLVDYDPKDVYSGKLNDDGTYTNLRTGHTYKIMKNTQNQMGRISNLITDMTLLGANDDEITRAVRHSMTVIDAEKHKLDWKQSEVDNDIPSLIKKYQAHDYDDGYGGSATLISRAKGRADVPQRQGTPKVNVKGKSWYDPSLPEGSLIYKTRSKKNPETGEEETDLYYADRKFDKNKKMYTIRTEDGRSIKYSADDKDAVARYTPVKRIDKDNGDVYFTDSTGTVRYRTKTRTQVSTKMAETQDARTLISKANTEMENIYADYANSMKDLARRARIELVNTPNLTYNKNARVTYDEEVKSLDRKLKTATINAIREREALRRANTVINKKQEANPNMSAKDLGKEKQRALTAARNEVGSVSRSQRNIIITDKEWEAIQAGAITDNVLTKILNNADPDSLRARATPRSTTQLSPARISRIHAMRASNFTVSQIAEAMGISSSTVSKYLKGEN